MTSIKQIFFILNNQCNLTCRHCCFECDNRKETKLEKTDVITLIEKSKSFGFDTIDFSGGEPTLFDGFSDILQCTLDEKFELISIASNLTNIKSLEGLFSNISDTDKQRLFFRIGLDAHNANLHDWLRGDGAFEELMIGIEFLKHHKIKLRSANTLLHLRNFKYLDSIVELVSQIGFSNHNWLSIFPYGRGSLFSKYQIPFNVWINDLYARSFKYAEKYNLEFTFCGPYALKKDYNSTATHLKLKECYSNGLIINADGKVFAGCLLNMFHSSTPIGFYHENFLDLISKTEQYFLNLVCEKCNIKFACKGVQINQIEKRNNQIC